jgi:hypothetical protein
MELYIWPLICIHSKGTILLLAMHIIYPQRGLHYPELPVQSQAGPLLDCILHMCSNGVHGTYCNCNTLKIHHQNNVSNMVFRFYSLRIN